MNGQSSSAFKPAQLLRVYLGESDRHDGRPMYEAIVHKARELQLAGATVLRGPMGYGARSRLHTTKILRLSEDLPLVIEIIDHAERIATLLPFIEETMTGGVVTVQDVHAIMIGRP